VPRTYGALGEIVANHKRRKSRNARAGCKLCKRWKIESFPTEHKDGERWQIGRQKVQTWTKVVRLCAIM